MSSSERHRSTARSSSSSSSLRRSQMSMDEQHSHHPHHRHHHLHQSEVASPDSYHHHRSASTYAKSPSSAAALERNTPSNGSFNVKRPTSSSATGSSGNQLGRSNSNPASKQRPGSATPASPASPNADSPPVRARRRTAAENQPEAEQGSGAFDMKQLQYSVEAAGEASSRSNSNEVSSSSGAGGNTPSSTAVDPKKERYRSLWSKVGKQGATADSGGPTTPKKKWDQVLNPLLQKQLLRKSSQLDMPTAVATAYLQQDPHQQINYMNAPNQSTTQCDCGYDSCPFCNLLLNMEMTDPNMLM